MGKRLCGMGVEGVVGRFMRKEELIGGLFA